MFSCTIGLEPLRYAFGTVCKYLALNNLEVICGVLPSSVSEPASVTTSYDLTGDFSPLRICDCAPHFKEPSSILLKSLGLFDHSRTCHVWLHHRLLHSHARVAHTHVWLHHRLLHSHARVAHTHVWLHHWLLHSHTRVAHRLLHDWLLHNNWLLHEWLVTVRQSSDSHCFGMICGLDNKSSCGHASVEELNRFVEMAVWSFEEVEVNFSVTDRL